MDVPSKVLCAVMIVFFGSLVLKYAVPETADVFDSAAWSFVLAALFFTAAISLRSTADRDEQ